ncbi:MAG: hypothetical protein KYX69_19585 [Sphingomonas sp.]|nr:hypothetical protein [Sphingomonas sp.]MDK2769906.1 hypothetical protein [Sphingomonas sp.]
MLLLLPKTGAAIWPPGCFFDAADFADDAADLDAADPARSCPVAPR